MSIVCPPFFGSLYWGMLIYFLSWNLLDVAHSYLTCCGGCICCFRFSRFGHSCLRQWLTCCVSGCNALMRITHRRRWLVVVFVMRPTNRMGAAQGLLKVDPGAELYSRHARYLQKCLGPRRHSSKILAPPERVRSWKESPLKLEKYVSLIWQKGSNGTI